MVRKRILIVNKFFYPRGGDCVHALNLKDLLQKQGHEVAVFAMQYMENQDTCWNVYFPDEVRFSGKDTLKAMMRVFGGVGVKERFKKIVSDFRPDIIHIHNIHSYLSPVVARLAHEMGIKVVWTLHDYKLICPSYSCLRDGKPCELCFTKISSVIRKQCMKGDMKASALAYFEALYWNKKKVEKWVDTFISPSAFMADCMQRAGFSRNKLQVLCNFIGEKYENKLSSEYEQAYCYVGRLSNEKGMGTLLRVASQLPYKLYIAGTGPLKEELQALYASENIVFLGSLNAQEVISLLSRVIFSVIPSEWYENNPLSGIESLCVGTPVLGARIGGIPELIKESETGVTFEAGNEKELKEKIIYLFNHRLKDRELIRKEALVRFSAQYYYCELMKIYDGK